MLTLLFLLGLMGQAKAAVQSEISGDLIITRTAETPLKMEIRGLFKTLTLTNVHTSYNTCLNGVYIVEENQDIIGTYTLVAVVDCDLEIYDQSQLYQRRNLLCPEVYAPVCGNLAGSKEIFSNLCDLNSAGAEFIDYGSCL